MPRIGFLHTAGVHVATFEGLVRAADADVACVHEVEPDLLERARRDGPTTEIAASILAMLERLVAQGTDVVVCTCSTLGPLAEALADRVSVPVLRVDRPMARAAVETGSRIAVVAALESTFEPTRALLTDEARRRGLSPTIVDVCVPQAWAAFESGNSDGYLRQIADAARSVAADVDVIVLAQASMMGAAAACNDLPTPVLASPVLAVRHALSQLGR